jgi:hypothetical protein
MPVRSEIVKEFGAIQTQRNANVKFYIDKFRGGFYANIREFIEGKNYKGPTRKGVKLNFKELTEIYEKTKDLNLDDPSIKDKEILRLEKNSIKDIVLKAAEYKGRVGLDIREWLKTDEYKGWTKNGVRFESANFIKFKEFVSQMYTEFGTIQSGA